MTAATGQNSPAEGLLPDESAVLPLATQENFPVAARVLGRETGRHLMAIYGFARLVDQLGDEAEGDRLALLDSLEAELDRVYSGEPEHPIMRTLQASVRERGLPRGPFERLIAANRRDQVQARYATFDDLVDYCTLSANPVGELVLYVFGMATPERIALSDRVCTALQLVEHWQDVAEDFAARARLPAGGGSRALRRDRRRPRRTRDGRRAARADGVRGRSRAAPAGRGRAARRHAAAAAHASRSRATSAAGARTPRRSCAPGTTCSPGPPRAGEAARIRETLVCWRHGR